MTARKTDHCSRYYAGVIKVIVDAPSQEAAVQCIIDRLKPDPDPRTVANVTDLGYVKTPSGRFFMRPIILDPELLTLKQQVEKDDAAARNVPDDDEATLSAMEERREEYERAFDEV